MKHIIKQIGVVLFFGVLVAVMNACSKSSDEKKETIPSDNVKVTTFAGSGSEGSADGTGTSFQSLWKIQSIVAVRFVFLICLFI